MKYKTAILAILSLFFLTISSCIRPAPGTYTSDPSSREEKIEGKKLRLEIYVLEHATHPVTDMEVKVETRESSVKGATNFRGRCRASVTRIESEPIKFVFRKDGFTSIEIVHHIPSGVSDAGLVFSFDKLGKVKFANYTVKGLYR